ncbi:MAG: hypothetical protein WC026_17180 [Hyphomicrobium sp.]|uniref:hypothetical protein n=1 Tax=Hyphomicrobium sp. TaxID=82 RepID=UPI003562701E
MESRQVRRARERRKAKFNFRTYPMAAQRDGSFTGFVRKNRKLRRDGNDHFVR